MKNVFQYELDRRISGSRKLAKTFAMDEFDHNLARHQAHPVTGDAR
jgi:hypothetical protein